MNKVSSLYANQWRISIVKRAPGSILYIFMQFLANFCQMISWRSLSGRHPLGEILDPPLQTFISFIAFL